MKEFRLPDPGEGLVEAEIVTWRVAQGDSVKINDIVVEVETSKSLVELPIPFAGTVDALLVAEGEMVDVGTPIIRIDDGTGGSAEPSPTAPETAEPEAAATRGEVAAGGGDGRVANLVGYGPRPTQARRRPRTVNEPATAARNQMASAFDASQPVSRRADERAPLEPETNPASTGPLPAPGQASTEPGIASGPVLAKPPVRKLARDLGVNLAQVVGSGDGGIITRSDVEAAAAPEEPSEPVPVVTGQDRRVPIKGVRKLTAEKVMASAFGAPHVTEWVTCDVSATVALVDRLKARRDFADVRVTPMLIVARAVCLALGRTPELNSSWDEANGEILIKGEVNLGIAAATPRGLMVPNIKGAQALGLRELADRFNTLVATAKDGRTQPADTARGSFTITNVGVFGVDGGTPILNAAEAGILCVGQIARRPWVVGTGADERIEPRWVTMLALSFDHRLADGEQGSRFLADVADILTDPGLALLYG